MSPKDRLQAIADQLHSSDKNEEEETVADAVEELPEIKRVAGDSTGPRCKDMVIIITGANSTLGIGRAAAHQFAANGARAVFVCDYSETHLDAVASEISAQHPGVECHARQFDAADEHSVEGVVKEAIKKYGRLDVFFANAGTSGTNKKFTETKKEDFERVMRTNVLSVFLAAKHAAPAMEITSPTKPAAGGSIILTASVAGLRSNAGATDYSASKAAVISVAQTTAYQLARSGVRCNAICPGLIETGMTEPVFEAARGRGTEGRIGQINPLGRAGAADEIARVALFLGSDESSYVNGQAWAVCGGLSAGHPYVLGKMS